VYAPSEFRILVLGLRILVLCVKVLGYGIRITNSGFRARDAECREYIFDFRYLTVSGVGFRISVLGYKRLGV
jgi:hypothetical protein